MSITSFLNRACKQTAVYWGAPIPDGYGGNTFDEPIEIYCRWENSSEIFSRVGAERKSEEVISLAHVYVLQDVEENGYLYLGELLDLLSSSGEIDSGMDLDPTEIEGCFKVQKFEKFPALGSSTEFLRKVYL